MPNLMEGVVLAYIWKLIFKVIMCSLLPIIIVYLFCQRRTIKDVAAGAVEG